MVAIAFQLLGQKSPLSPDRRSPRGWACTLVRLPANPGTKRTKPPADLTGLSGRLYEKGRQ